MTPSKSGSDASCSFFDPARTVSFADVAHQTLLFNRRIPHEDLLLRLIDTRWIQRLRNISQTGNTKLVYMFAEHSRFGHSLGVAYLALMLMKHLKEQNPNIVEPYEASVAAAALLHDIGHIAPGSHLAEKIWAPGRGGQHELLSGRIIREDYELAQIMDDFSVDLRPTVLSILREDENVPAWTKAVISGGGWNADRGNWAIVDSTMCSVSYGRYNVAALIDAFRLSEKGELVLQENRLDALTHFFVARDSMYRQVYQHRVLQAADALTKTIIARARELAAPLEESVENIKTRFVEPVPGMICDKTMLKALISCEYGSVLDLDSVFEMTESWWQYHISSWCKSNDEILADLCLRLRDRRLFKTVRLPTKEDGSLSEEAPRIVEEAKQAAESLSLDPKFYVHVIEEKDKHRSKSETAPLIALEKGGVAPVNEVEPLIAQIMRPARTKRTWLAVPKRVKEILGRRR